MTSPVVTVQEALETFRKYDIPMSQNKLQESLRTGIFPFGQAIELATWSFTIWRLPFYEWLRDHGVPVEELRQYKEEIRARGWEENG